MNSIPNIIGETPAPITSPGEEIFELVHHIDNLQYGQLDRKNYLIKLCNLLIHTSIINGIWILLTDYSHGDFFISDSTQCGNNKKDYSKFKSDIEAGTPPLILHDLFKARDRNGKIIIHKQAYSGLNEPDIAKNKHYYGELKYNSNHLGFYSIQSDTEFESSIVEKGLIQVLVDKISSLIFSFRKQEKTDTNQILDLLIEEIPEAVYISDLNGKFIMVNGHMAELFDSTPETLTGKTFFDICSQDQAKHIHMLENKILKTGKESTTRNQYKIHENYLTTRVCLRNDQNLPYGILAVIKCDKKAAKKSTLRFDNLLENIPVGLYTTDAMEQIIETNQKFLEITGYESTDSFQGKDILDFYVDPNDRLEWQSQIQKYGELNQFETRWYRKDGQEIWVSESAHLMEDENGEQYCEVTLEDISERKGSEFALQHVVNKLEETQEELNDRAKWLAALNIMSAEIARGNDFDSILKIAMNYLHENFMFNLAGIGLFSETQETMRIRYIQSKKMESHLTEKIRKGTVLSLDCNDKKLVKPDKPGAFELNLSDFDFENNKSEFISFLYILYCAELSNGIFIPLLSDGRQIGLLFLFQNKRKNLDQHELYFLNDLAEHISIAAHNFKMVNKIKDSYSKLKKAQQMMMEQERLKAIGQVASGITHDINNTLAPITLYSEILLESENNLSSKARKYLSIIQNAATDIEHVTQRLKHFYKKDKKANAENFRLKDIFNEVIDLSRPRWESIPNKNGIKIKLATEIDDSVQIFINKSELREALINCIYNSVDALPKGGTITLKGESNQNNTIISIIDNGEGMTLEQQKHCSEPFFSTKGTNGSGLGLSAVAGMASNYGGDMEILSVLDEGTEIKIFIPHPGKSSSTPIQKDSNVLNKSLRILCIDDDKRIRDGLNDMLILDGHQVQICSNGSSGINKFLETLQSNEKFDLVTTDLGMPGMDGYSVAREIKNASKNTPVLLLSGWGNLMFEENSLPDYIDAVIGKPPRIDELRREIYRLFNKQGNSDD